MRNEVVVVGCSTLFILSSFKILSFRSAAAVIAIYRNFHTNKENEGARGKQVWHTHEIGTQKRSETEKAVKRHTKTGKKKSNCFG